MADKQNGDEARLPNGEDAATCVDAAGLLTDDNENTSQGKLVTPSGVPGLCVPDKAAAPNNLITEVSVPLSGESTPCDGGVEVMPQDSTRATTAPESNGCKAATLKSGEKRERESDSDNASEIPVKRRLTLSEDTEEETVQDYDARCAELWIDAEIAACEAYEFSQVNRPRQVPRDPRRNKSSPAQPVTQRTDDAKTAITACFQEFIKVFRQTEVLRRADFSGMINAVRGMRRDFTALSNEIHNIRAEQRQTLDVLSLMAERMNVIQMYVTDMHKKMTDKR